MEKASTQFKDRPIKPLESAVWWIEYVLRSPDALPALKPLGIYQPWYLRRSLDVWLFIVCIILIVLVGLLAVALALLFKSKSQQVHLKPNLNSKGDDDYKGKYTKND